MMAHALYMRDQGPWLVCGGNRPGEHDEPPVTLPGNADPNFPFWYEALQPYIAPFATPTEARRAFTEREGRGPTREELANEIAELCRILDCRRKRGAAIGYGYNYAAPYGVSAVYPREGSPWTWEDRSGKAYDYPVDAEGTRAPVPILWYGQRVKIDVLSAPSSQIAFFEAGRVTNDAELTTKPEEWEESQASNVTGYVRFPLCEAYKQSAKYRTEKAWRPAGRHRGKVAVAMFDGSAKVVPIAGIVNYPWGHPKCLFDNEPPHRPPTRTLPAVERKSPSP